MAKSKGAIDKLKERFEKIGKLRTIASSIGTYVLGSFPAWLTSSRRLQYVIAVGVAFGLMLGFFLVPLVRKRSPPIRRYFGTIVVGVIVAIAELVIMNPANEWAPGILRSTQDFLMRNPIVANPLMFACVSAISFSVMTLICIAAIKEGK